ncbi:uncharacterized protein LOC143375727 [Andrena cerasifolii]|uniref:uncharacterized protein LOC143375727 n=1 Tax=Andrena cerasifolii TaxID=2819439 RepID=UPI004037BF64
MPNGYCVLCGNQDKAASYYAFPLVRELRKKWLAFCDIEEHVLSNVTRLCWRHFPKDDIIYVGKSTILKGDVVPSINRTKKVHKRSDLIKNFKDSILEKQKSATGKGGTADDRNCKNVDIDNTNLGDRTIDDGRVTDKTVRDGAVDDLSSSNVDTENANFDNRTVNPGNFEFVSVNDDPTVLLEETSGPINRPPTPPNCESIQCFQTPAKAARNPRHSGDIRTLRRVTHRKAIRALQLAKLTIANQHRKIKSLQQARNRLIGHVMTMKVLVKYFKTKNRMMEMTTENLMATLPSVMKGSWKRKIEREK